eukprot:CAMPEP_0184723710 /NCGR_PEP_ID=MMETSP0314-20130426/25934_1 /TAXON_ID=38298 /ORGANISM="Rhodella maculata, Strain CCMP 736" /LENGTH=59 /DNA_ID=CAMNT_0027188557 /DNA_START=33 /DNA_END=208 /DNA_ORIENTATION=+
MIAGSVAGCSFEMIAIAATICFMMSIVVGIRSSPGWNPYSRSFSKCSTPDKVGRIFESS